MRMQRTFTIAALAASSLALAACSSGGEQDPGAQPSDTGSPGPTATGDAAPDLGSEVTVVTHDSFAVPDDVLAAFEEESGLDVTFVAPGDAGALVNQLILTKDAPLGDVVYGIDNTFASRAIAEGVLADYESQAPAAADAADYALDGSGALTAIDYSDVCLNYDLAWFEEAGLDVPQSLGALSDPQYRGLVSVTNPATSSPGLALLLATVAEFGEDGWEDYWRALAENELRVTASWSDTYFTDFSAPNYGGDYPIVLSYASSPPSEVIDGEPTTAALLDTCFRQVEYAGVLEGARNPAAGQAVIDWMLSDEFQATIPDNMYVYPVSSSVDIPEAWAEFAPLAEDPHTLAPDVIDANRDAWIETWTSIVLG
ncbi:thiamine ABC transporter substrate-binding protein [Demequina activiva]|uniref:Thiamine ABC transporter substrate-binding protein n=1 Tax=Demequina activiva TaxID=1582364 RepID=A0A919UKG4_9MICO|nr:thiamine ABC transporter substrate-binding protein [Demequina activiva]GIG54940.1 thiamine ABC transporter substrate-binding protein [Demequina activiva]